MSRPQTPGVVRMLFTVSLLSPTGRMRVTPTGQIVPEGGEYLTDKDVRKLEWGVEEVRRILGHEPMKSRVIKVSDPQVPSGPLLRNWVLKNAKGNNHWAGSCRMGNREDVDKGIVVDEDLVVRGTKNLMVADASIMPRITNGNVHSTVVLIGKKAAGIIANGIGGKREE